MLTADGMEFIEKLGGGNKAMTYHLTIKQLLAKRWVKIAGGVVVALVLFFLLLPLGVKYYLTDWLLKNGADSATINKLRFNPFTAQLTVGGVDVQKEGRSILRDASMVVDIGLTSLLKRNIHLEKVNYHDLAIDLEQYDNGSWRFGSITVQGDRKEQQVDSNEELASRWNILADDVTLTDSSVHLTTPELDLTLFIDQAEIKRLTTREGQPAGTFTFKGQLNNEPVELQLDTVQLVPALRLGGRVAIGGFNLKDLSRLMHDVLPTVGGAVGLDGQAVFTQSNEQGMHAEYDGNFKVSGSDLGNKDFTSKLDELSWKGKVMYDSPAQGSPTVALDGLLAARTLHLSIPSADLVTKLKHVDLNGATKLTLRPNMLINNDGSLQLTGLELTLPSYGIIDESLSWKGTVQYDSKNPEPGQSIHADGALDLGTFEVAGDEQDANFTISGQNAAWLGTVGFSQPVSGTRSVVELDGTLTGGSLSTTLAESQMSLGQEKVELKTKSTVGMGEELDIDGKSSLAVQNFSLGQGQEEKPVVFFDQLTIDGLANEGGRKLAITDMSTKGLRATVAGNLPVQIDIPEIALTDIATEDLATFTMRELQLQKPVVTASQNEQELVRLDGVTLTDISLAEQATVGVKQLRLQNLAMLDSGDTSQTVPAVSFSDATLTAIKWSNDTGFQGDTLHFNDLVATVVRDKDGNINIDQQLARMQAPATEPADGAASESPAEAPTAQPAAQESRNTPFKLQKIDVAGKSHLFFEDYTLAVPYKTDLIISVLELKSLDSTQPDQKTSIRLQGELEERAPIELSGNIFPFKKKPKADLQMDLKNYPLSSLSAYTVQSVGTAMASGQLQLKSSMKLADDRLDLKNDLLLKKLKTKTISPKLAAELDNQLPIPLDAALSVLRDNDQNIKLDVPLSGPISKLNVGISDVLITALSKAIIPAASAYLTYALGPYGALAYVGMKVGEKMLQVDLPPLLFAPQKKALTADHLKYLERIGKILQDKQKTDLQICPRVASWEFITEQEKAAVQSNDVPIDEKKRKQMVELGQQRAEAVQSLMQSKYGIDKNRLLICDTEIATQKKADPAVLLQL